jgi:hypothetical protein
MPLAMIAVMILLAMGAGLLSLGVNVRIYSIRMASDIEARCAADAGLTMALYEMNNKLQAKSWDGSSLPLATDISLPSSDGVYSYRVTGDLGGGYTIESIGESGQARRSVQATIRLESAFNHAILTKQTLILKSGTLVDGYNSADPDDKDIDVSIGSQSTSDSSIVLNMGSIINGDVVVAGGDVDTVIKDLGATVTGDKYVSGQQLLPKVTVPESLAIDMGAISATGATVQIDASDSGTYTGITLQQLVVKEGKGPKAVETTTPAILEVTDGDVALYLTGDIQLGNGCEIVVKEGASLTIYTDGNIHCRFGSSINSEAPSEQASTLEIYATGEGSQSFDIKAKSNFTGVIYAPDADVDLYAGGDAYGSIIANNFDFKAGGNFYYDEALSQKNTIDDEAVVFVVDRWSEAKLLSE